MQDSIPKEGWLCWAFIPDGGYKNGLLLSFFSNGSFVDVNGFAYGATERVTCWQHIEVPEVPPMESFNKVIEAAAKLEEIKKDKMKALKEKKKGRAKNVLLALAEGDQPSDRSVDSSVSIEQ